MVKTGKFHLTKTQLWADNAVLTTGDKEYFHFYIDVNQHLQMVKVSNGV